MLCINVMPGVARAVTQPGRGTRWIKQQESSETTEKRIFRSVALLLSPCFKAQFLPLVVIAGLLPKMQIKPY